MDANTVRKLHTARPTVSIRDIEQLQAMREMQQALKDRLARMDAAVKESEDSILDAIDAGADISQLPFAISVHVTERRNPSWKKQFIEQLGEEAADAVIAATPPIVHRKLVIK